jgi:hypothetical protein
MNAYTENGYANRDEYLKSLAAELELDYKLVRMTAELYGPAEDFDGLVTTLQDYADEIERKRLLGLN